MSTHWYSNNVLILYDKQCPYSLHVLSLSLSLFLSVSPSLSLSLPSLVLLFSYFLCYYVSSYSSCCCVPCSCTVIISVPQLAMWPYSLSYHSLTLSLSLSLSLSWPSGMFQRIYTHILTHYTDRQRERQVSLLIIIINPLQRMVCYRCSWFTTCLVIIHPLNWMVYVDKGSCKHWLYPPGVLARAWFVILKLFCLKFEFIVIVLLK